jgi:DNA-binding MarR family transcriptional regulator
MVSLTEPAWDVLLDLYYRTRRNEQVSVSNACVASGVPSATALRWIDILVDGGLIRREADHVDRRRTWLTPTEPCMAQMEAYLSTLIVMRNVEHLLAS